MRIQNKQTKVSDAKASNTDAAMDSLVRILASRERSVHETQKRLLEKGYKEQTVSGAIERALSCGLLDDERFACGFIKGKLNAGWGKRRIEQELYRFGVATEDIEGYPDAFFDEEEQMKRALLALERHHSRSKNPRQAAYRFLISKGYGSDIASAAVRIAQAEEEL